MMNNFIFPTGVNLNYGKKKDKRGLTYFRFGLFVWTLNLTLVTKRAVTQSSCFEFDPGRLGIRGIRSETLGTLI